MLISKASIRTTGPMRYTVIKLPPTGAGVVATAHIIFVTVLPEREVLRLPVGLVDRAHTPSANQLANRRTTQLHFTQLLGRCIHHPAYHSHHNHLINNSNNRLPINNPINNMPPLLKITIANRDSDQQIHSNRNIHHQHHLNKIDHINITTVQLNPVWNYSLGNRA
ncbi:hypothetical protein PSTG_04113 [Puccinia striiformis f. sp. tritici PST-78]|uniref:Uncharacterized protein n=1 Tax=Puccinia striiformis f. sp. tritici PST-78 TaxID=1165861 RepID=A0A0L0VU63_9BASI|nr:hypothetical protein PSTG_04113 [Puccinia striiformis f. sp. tritici PST-78]